LKVSFLCIIIYVVKNTLLHKSAEVYDALQRESAESFGGNLNEKS